MIQQSIKKYQEPETWKPPVTLLQNNYKEKGYGTNYEHSSYQPNYNRTSKERIELAIEEAKSKGITVGQKWRYKTSPSHVLVIGFETSPEKVYSTDYGPMIIRGQRHGDDGSVSAIFTYGINELIGENMELIEND